MSTTVFAPFTITFRRLVISADIFRTLSDLHCFPFPQSESVDGTCRPASTGLTMAIARSNWLAADRKLNRAAKTAAFITFFVVDHNAPPVVVTARQTARLC